VCFIHFAIAAARFNPSPDVTNALTTGTQNTVVFDVPFTEGTPCGLCPNRVFSRAGGASGLAEHYRAHHHTYSVYWGCVKCSRRFLSYLGGTIHHSKCSGGIVEQAQDFPCLVEGCTMSFSSIRGRSLHTRRAHPEFYFRHAPTPASPERVRPQRLRVWSSEELEIFNREMAIHHGRRGYGVSVAAHLPHKTAKQVRERARLWRRDTGADSDSSEGTSEADPEGEADEVADDGASVHGGDVAVVEPVLGEAIVSPAASPSPSSADRQPSVLVAEGDASAPEELSYHDAPRTERADSDSSGSRALIEAALAIEVPGSIERIHAVARGFDQILRDEVSCTQERLDALVDELTDVAKGGIPPNRAGGTRPPSRRRLRDTCKRRRYANTQDMFRQCPQNLARLVEEDDFGELEGRGLEVSDPPAELANLFGSLWGVEGPRVPCEPNVNASSLSTFRPFLAGEVHRRLQALKRNTAPGPDGVKRDHLVSVAGMSATLAKLFGVIVGKVLYPTSWRTNRTAMIPKPGKDPRDPKAWRPITIGPIMARVFASALAERIGSYVNLSERQKGFVPVNGTYENTFLLDEALRSVRRGVSDSLVMTQVDIAKAFDTVPHSAIIAGLASQGVPQPLVRLVASSYEGVTTSFRAGGMLRECRILRGVKQGCPLSPLLFNIVLDPLIRDLWTNRGGGGMGVLAFADDLTLLDESPDSAQRQLDRVVEFLGALGMSLSPEKCLALWMKVHKRSWICGEPGLRIRDSRLATIPASGQFTYLGMVFNPRSGMDNSDVLRKFEACLPRVGRLALKPRQKLCLVTRYLLPRYLYRLTLDPPSKTRLAGVDRVLRGWVKRTLHLVESTPNGLVYAKKRDGGLGVPKLEGAVILAHLRAGLAVDNSSDPLIGYYVEANRVRDSLAKKATSLGLAWPSTRSGINAFGKGLNKLELSNWQALGATGHGVKAFCNDPVGNRWLVVDSLLSESRFINALKLRSNTLGVREAMRRADPGITSQCRRCGGAPETLQHVLAVCPSSKPKIIRRHDEVRDVVVKGLSDAGYALLVEDSFEVNGERLKPDIVAVDSDGVIVLDVAVAYESGDALGTVAEGKVRKYSVLSAALKERFGRNQFRVVPIVVGGRGAMPGATMAALRGLGIPDIRNLSLTLSMVALRSSLSMACDHLDR